MYFQINQILFGELITRILTKFEHLTIYYQQMLNCGQSNKF
jgi:hypothetical protein